MNFFSHDVILPDDAHPLMRLGSAVPDLWSRLPKRPLPFRLLPALRGAGTVEASALADGIESHLLADECFHAHPEFVARMERVEAEIEALWPEVKHAEMAAHILIEMVLDRWLVLHHPGRLAGYYACFTPACIAEAARLGTTTDESRDVLAGILTFFGQTRFLEDYRTPEGLAHRFGRAWSRTPFAGESVPEAALAGWVAERYEAMIPGSDVLVDDARAAVRAGLGKRR